jgi:hypothetical protein
MTDITITLTGQDATHLVVALSLMIDPEVGPLFGRGIQRTLQDVRDRVLQAQAAARQSATVLAE